MVEYYPKNNTRPTVVAILVAGILILGNEMLRSYIGINIPRVVAVPISTILGLIILVKANSKE